MSINKVLIVDDSQIDLCNLESIIEDAGCIVLKAVNGKEALVAAKEGKPDIIFMDIVMDEMDGYEATRMLAKDSATKNIPVIFVSSKRQKADRVWAKMQGGKELVSKPFTADQIIEQIRFHA